MVQGRSLPGKVIKVINMSMDAMAKSVSGVQLSIVSGRGIE
jgi:hypothetical protein